MNIDIIFQEVKTLLEITTDDEDISRGIKLKMLAVTNYLSNGGASEASINSPLGVTCVAIGVNDLMERRTGEIKFSPAFNVIANQICRG